MALTFHGFGVFFSLLPLFTSAIQLIAAVEDVADRAVLFHDESTPVSQCSHTHHISK